MFYSYNISILNKKQSIHNFMYWKNFYFFLSIICILLSILSIGIFGFNWSIDFTGGFLLKVHCDELIEIDKILDISNSIGLKNIHISHFGSIHDVIIRSSYLPNISILDFSHKILSVFYRYSQSKSQITCSEYIGPSADNNLIKTLFLSLILAFLFLVIYIVLRFSWSLSIGILLSLLHDVLLTLGCISIFRIEINSIIIVSLLSIIGYSLNDSIVVSDRIRENIKRFEYLSFFDVLNLSLTQVYSRTLMTSATTFSVAAILYYFGNEIIKSFSFTMMVGIFVGTLSSIYVSSSLSFQCYKITNNDKKRS
ncbi:MAG: protein translocase subunit SecF [Buchnera aphidicola (Melaphis rhois)]